MTAPKSGSSDRSPAGIVSGGAVQAAARVFAIVAQLGLFLYAVRLLDPSAFGLFAIISTITQFLALVASAGWKEFVLNSVSGKEDADRALTAAAIAGAAIAGVCALTAAATSFWMADAAMLFLALSVTILFAPIERAIGALIVREGRLRTLAVVSVVSEGGGLLVGLVALSAGLGVLALAFARIAMQALGLCLGALLAQHRFRLLLDKRWGSEMYSYSRSILAIRVVDYWSWNAAVVIIGVALGAADAGQFRAAQRIVSAFQEMVQEPLRAIGWIVFRRAAAADASAEQVRSALVIGARTYFPLHFLCLIPLFAGLALVSDDLVLVAFGDAWAPAAPIVTILAIATIIRSHSLVNEPILSIAGRLEVLPRMMLVNMVISLATLLGLAWLGLTAAALARLIAATAFMYLCHRMQSHHAGVPWRDHLVGIAPIALAVLVMTTSVVLTRSSMLAHHEAPAVRLAIEVAVGALAYVGCLMLWPRQFLRGVLSMKPGNTVSVQ